MFDVVYDELEISPSTSVTDESLPENLFIGNNFHIISEFLKISFK